MPSGSKKRKAAKKKKENQPNSHQDPSSQSRGSDGKDSDVSEASSQDPQNQQNTSIEGGEEVIHAEKIVPADGGVKIDAVDKSVIAAEEVNVTSANREVGIEDDSSQQDVRLKHKEGATKGSRDGGSSRSSSSSSSSSSRSSSDDESHGIKSSQAVEDIAPVVDSVTVTHSLSESKVETSDSVAIDDAVEETVEKERSYFEDKVIISTTTSETTLEPKEEATIHSIENISTISDPKEECGLQATDDQLIVSYNAPATIAENGANNVVDSGVTEPVVRTAPHPVQTTSWKSCCGLFELFAGSRA